MDKPAFAFFLSPCFCVAFIGNVCLPLSMCWVLVSACPCVTDILCTEEQAQDLPRTDCVSMCMCMCMSYVPQPVYRLLSTPYINLAFAVFDLLSQIRLTD